MKVNGWFNLTKLRNRYQIFVYYTIYMYSIKTSIKADEESASGVQSPVTPHPPVILQPASIASMPSTSAQHAASVADKKDKGE